MTPDKLLMLKRQITKYPAITAAELKETVPEVSPFSDQTIQHHLQKSLNLPSISAAQKPLLTPRMKKKRLAFCAAYKDWSAADWKKVMYSEESTFHCIRFIKTRVRRAKGLDWFDSRFMSVTVKHLDTVIVGGVSLELLGEVACTSSPRTVP
jgi:hypothetical protein